MSLHKVMYMGLFCDAPACESHTAIASLNPTQARIAAASDGWLFIPYTRWNDRGGHGVGHADFCPDHAPSAPELIADMSKRPGT